VQVCNKRFRRYEQFALVITAALLASCGSSKSNNSAPTTTAAGGAATTTAAPPASSPGVTGTTVTIGLHLANPAQDKILEQLGEKSVTTGNEQNEALAVVAYLNAHGGLDGHQIKTVTSYYGSTSTQPYSIAYQDACATFTQDNKVFAAIDTSEFQQLDVLASCLEKAHSILVFQSRLIWDDQQFNSFSPYVYSPSYLDGPRYSTVVNVLKSTGYFQSGAKVALIYLNSPSVVSVKNNVVIPALQQNGVTLTDQASLLDYNSVAGISTAGNEMASAVIKFKQEGVTNVFFFGTSGIAPTFFLAAAKSQGYAPKLAFTSTEIPQITAVNNAKAELAGAVGVGWWPTYDVDNPQDTTGNSARNTCDSIYSGAGITFTSRFAYNDAIAICDSLMFIHAATAAGNGLSPAAFRSGVVSLGTSYVSPMTFQTKYTDTVPYAGAIAVRPLAYMSGCSCWQYTGPPVTASS
jgi:hypothetical protein